MSIRWDSENDWKNNQDSSGTTGRNGELKQGYSRERPPLSDDLIGYWPLHDENATDYSGNDNHGSLNGGVTTGVAGKGGLQAMSFDGSDDNINLGNISEVFDASSGTFSAWINFDKVPPEGSDNSDAYYLFHAVQDTSEQIIVVYTPDDNSITDISSSSLGMNYETDDNRNSVEFNPENDASWSDDAWHLVTFTWDESEDKIAVFADGDLQAETTSGGAPQGLSNFTIGSNDGNYGYFHGYMSDIRIYNRALTAQEIKTLYKWGSGDFARPLNDQNSSSAVSRWAFDGNANDLWDNNGGDVNGGSFISNAIRGQSLSQSNGDNVVYDNESQFDFTSSDAFTISAWGYFPEEEGNTWVFTKSDNGTGYSAIVRGTDSGTSSAIWLGIGDDDGNTIQSYSPMKWDRWIHIGWRYDGSGSASGIRTFVNGMRQEMTVDSDQTLGSITNNQNPETRQSPGSNSSSSILDDLRVYSKALNQKEIFQLYRWGTRGRDMRKYLVNH